MTLASDIKYAARSLRRTPGITALAVLILALAIGANTALFSLLDAAVLRPLPFWQPNDLAGITQVRTETGEDAQVSALDYLDWRKQATSFSELAAWREWSQALTGLGDPEELGTVRVTANFFTTLGVAPMLGRSFHAEEDQEGRHHVALLSHGFWQQRLASDPAVVGRTLILDGSPFTVVGVMPAGFRFPDSDGVSLWTPMAFDSVELSRRTQRMFNVIGRLKAGTTVAAAQAELTTIGSRIALEDPRGTRGLSPRVSSSRDVLLPDSRVLLLLMSAVVLVLLIGCANVANLLLAKGAAQERGIAIRIALGASRAQVAGLALIESLILGLMSGALGLLFGVWLRDALLRLNPGMIPHWNPVTLDPTVLGFTLALSLAVALTAGMAPALRLRSAQVGSVLKQAPAAGSAGRGTVRARGLLVVSEISLAFVLAVGALLLVRTMQRLAEVEPGFRPNHLLAVNLSLSDTRYPEDARQREFFVRVLERVNGIPGVVSAAMVTTLPMNPVGIDYDLPLEVVGQPVTEEDRPRVDFRMASPRYFQTLGVGLLAGREFKAQDGPLAPRVMVINQTAARRLFANREPLGQEIEVPGGGRYAVVGIVHDVHHRGLEASPRPEMFVPFEQYYSHGNMSLVVRTVDEPATAAAAIAAQVHAIDRDQPVGVATPVTELIGASVSSRRFSTILLGSLASLGLLLAALGVYGVMAVSVSQRRAELGIRLALGAGPGTLMRMVVRQSMRFALIGILAGTVGAVVVTRWLTHLLYGVKPLDTLAMVGAALLLSVAALTAAILPARRAARVDPMVALRAE
jgi:putative ABC transport system permease protein